jgi:hypothetical protein
MLSQPLRRLEGSPDSAVGLNLLPATACAMRLCSKPRAPVHARCRLRSFLVVEDDAIFLPRAGKRFRMAIAQLPDDWDALYLGYNRYFLPSRDCADSSSRPAGPHRRGAEARPIPGASPAERGCQCFEKNVCQAVGGLLHTHAIAYHERALDWLLPLLSKADESNMSRLMPVDLEIRTHLEQHKDSIRVYAVLPSPLIGQNRSARSNIYRAGMYETM